MKLTSIEKQTFRNYRDEMIENGIQWAFCRKTGITIIYKTMPKGRFVKLAVAYCNEQDQFKKKFGLIVAFERWCNDMAIQIPANIGWNVDATIEQFAELITHGNQFLEWPMD